MSTFGTRNDDGSWDIDGLRYSQVGEAGWGRSPVGEPTPIVWGDTIGLRQPLAINQHEIQYAASPVEHVLRWAAEQADFARSQAQLGATLDFEALVAAVPPTGGRFTRWLGDYRVRVASTRIEIPQTPGELEPVAIWDYDSPEARDELGITDGSLQAYYDTLAEDTSGDDPLNYYTTTYTVQGVDGASEVSTAIVGDQVFCELLFSVLIQVDYEEYIDGQLDYQDQWDDYDEYRLLVVLPADPQGEATVTPQWILHLDETLPAARDYRSDIVVTGGRVALLCEGPQLLHVDVATGTDLQEVDLTTVQSAGNNALGILNPCVGNRWVNIYAANDDGRVWSGGEGTALFCADLGSNSLVWVRDPDDDNTVLHPTGFDGVGLAALFERKAYETIVDHLVQGIQWDAVTTPTERVEVARGLSYVAGRCCLDPDSGETLGESLFDGAEDAGEFSDSQFDYVTGYGGGGTVLGEPAVVQDWAPTGSATIPPYNPDAEPGDPDWGGYNAANYQPPDDPQWPWGVDASVGWSHPPNPINYYNGELSDPYQDTNTTGTYIEGASPNPGEPGDFQGAQNYVTFQVSDPYNDIDQANVDAHQRVVDGKNSIKNDDPGGTGASDAARSMAVVETELRQRNGDWIRAIVCKARASLVAIFNEAENPYTNSVKRSEEFNWELIELSYRENGSSGLAPTLGNMVWNFYAVPDPLPAVGESPTINGTDKGWSDEFKTWHANRDASTPNPWEGELTYETLIPRDSGGVFERDYQLIWRSDFDTLSRQRTPEPIILAGPTCSDGTVIVYGPRYIATGDQPLRWEATKGGVLVWASELAKLGAFPGPSIWLGTTVVTGYQHGVNHYLCVLNGSTGAVLHDVQISESFLDLLYGDNTIWKQQSATAGLTN